jgi:hypothetical protein
LGHARRSGSRSTTRSNRDVYFRNAHQQLAASRTATGAQILFFWKTIASSLRRTSGPAIERHLPKSRWAPSPLRISYEASRGALREILAVCTNQEFSVSRVQVEDKPFRGKGQSGAQAGKGRGTGWEDHPEEIDEASLGDLPREGTVTLLVEVRGARPVGRLAARLNEIAGVTAARVGLTSRGKKGGRKAALALALIDDRTHAGGTLAAPRPVPSLHASGDAQGD